MKAKGFITRTAYLCEIETEKFQKVCESLYIIGAQRPVGNFDSIKLTETSCMQASHSE